MWSSHWSGDRWRFPSSSTYSGPSWSTDLPCSDSPVSKCTIGIDTRGNWKHLCGVKATGISSPYQESKPREISEIKAIIKEAARTIPCDTNHMAVLLTSLACVEMKWILENDRGLS